MLNRKSFNFFIQIRKLSNNVGVIGVPFSKGQPKVGTDIAPTVLRQSGLIQELVEFLPNLKINDYGDIIYKPDIHTTTENLKNWNHVTACNHALSNNVMKIIQDNCTCLTLGGDHSIGLGSVDGHARALENKEMALLWVDAHADLNVPKSTPTGNCHGMPVSLLINELEEHWSSVPGLEWHKPRLRARNVAFVGIRSVDPFERAIINKYGITAFGMEEIQRYGIHAVIKMALNNIDPDSNRSLHVSFDIDSLDVLEAPSTGTPVRGGLTLREGIEVMEAVYKTGRMQVMDLVEVNPSVGTVSDIKITVDAAKHVVLAAFGHKRTGSVMFDNYT